MFIVCASQRVNGAARSIGASTRLLYQREVDAQIPQERTLSLPLSNSNSHLPAILCFLALKTWNDLKQFSQRHV